MANYESALFAEWRSSSESPHHQEPDIYVAEPRNDFVLCRDKSGNPTAVYSQDVWDFADYAFSLKQSFPFKMKPASGDNEWSRNCNREFKFLVYNYIYFAEGGRIGRLAVSTLSAHHRVLKNVVKFAEAAQQSELARGITFFECLSSAPYMRAFNEGLKQSDRKNLQSILFRLSKLGEERLGFKPADQKQIPYKRESGIGYPVIPLRIYLGRIIDLDNIVARIYPYRENLKNFIREFEHPLGGLAKSTQVNKTRPGQKYAKLRGQFQPTLSELVEKHGLGELLTDHLSVANRNDVATMLIAIQVAMKESIHLYTGMRDMEVSRMLTGAASHELISEGIRNDEGEAVIPERVVQLISTTTKFSGYKATAKWIACESAVRALAICESIADGIWFLHGETSRGKEIFVSPAKVRKIYLAPSITAFNIGNQRVRPLPPYEISESDRDELRVTFTNPLWDTTGKYDLGKNWRFTTHQYRRSLAFYASNSGLVNGASLTKQFKHLSQQMRMYYQRSFSGLKTIFGYYDEKKCAFKIPEGHIISEFQVSQPIHVVDLLMADLTDTEEVMFGGAGSFMSKQRARIQQEPQIISQVRSETEKQVQSGLLAFKESPAGGCTKVGPCKDNMLGNVTACLNCAEAILKPSKIRSTLEVLKEEASFYSEATPEKIMVDEEVLTLEKFLSKKAA